MQLDKIKTNAIISFEEDFENKQKIRITYNEENLFIDIDSKSKSITKGYAKHGEDLEDKTAIIENTFKLFSVIGDKLRGEYERQLKEQGKSKEEIIKKLKELN